MQDVGGQEPVEAPGEAGPDGEGVSQLAEISRAMVRLYKVQFGRGPVKARSAWAGPDMLVSALEDTFTPAERNLAEMGEHQRLRDVRMYFQYATVSDFVKPVEEITGRTVRAFLSAIDTRTDVAMETFVFYPRGEEGPSRSELGSD
jgi:uncharacterized protein YbcI